MSTKYLIKQGDCLDWLPKVREKSVDMVLCDLPYGTTQNKWDTIIPLDYLWNEYNRILKTEGLVVLTAAQPFTSVVVSSRLNEFKYEWIWEKEAGTGFLNAKKQPLRSHENILVFYSALGIYNPQMTIGKPYTCKKGGLTNNYNPDSKDEIITVNEGTRYPKTVLQFQRDKPKLHPTQKPVELMKYLIRTYTNTNMLVIDNCMGVGTTGVAALEEGRRFIGIELDPEYFAIAKERIEKTVKNMETQKNETINDTQAI